MFSYHPKYTESFKKCVDKHKDKKKRIESLVNRILENPYYKSHLLQKVDNIDLRGKRSRHLTGNFVMVYMICEECIKEAFRNKYNYCQNCAGELIKQVIFLAFDKHQDIYSKEWIGY